MVVASQPAPLDKKDALRHMEKTNPETLALAYDWEDIAAKVVHVQEKIKECVTSFILVSLLDLGRAGFHLLSQILKLWGWFICTTVRPSFLFFLMSSGNIHLYQRGSPNVRHDACFLLVPPCKRILLTAS